MGQNKQKKKGAKEKTQETHTDAETETPNRPKTGKQNERSDPTVYECK